MPHPMATRRGLLASVAVLSSIGAVAAIPALSTGAKDDAGLAALASHYATHQCRNSEA
jgi:hypothetical protein